MGLESDCSLPVEISDDENLIRGIYFHVHVKKNGTLKWQAFDPTPGTDEISVMRSAGMSATACKQKAKSIENAPHKLYRGLAVLNTGSVRAEHMRVSDSRKFFCGHADISTGVVAQKPLPNVPRDSHDAERAKFEATKLIKLSQYYPDGNSESEEWDGPNLLPPA